MAIDYAGDRDGWIYDAIAEDGQTMTYTRITGSVYDATAGTNVPTTANTTVSGFVVEQSEKDIEGSLVKRNDKRVVIEAKALAAAGVTPSENDSITISSTIHKIVHLEPVSPAGTALVFKAWVRAT